jgi:hypothetical protein
MAILLSSYGVRLSMLCGAAHKYPIASVALGKQLYIAFAVYAQDVDWRV